MRGGGSVPANLVKMTRRGFGRYLLASASLGALLSFGACSSFSGEETPSGGGDAATEQAVEAADAAVDTSTAADAPDGRGAGYRDEVLADAPLAYWRMGPKTGGVIVDETGGGNSLSLVGSGHTLGVEGALAGDVDTAIHFDGNGYARAADSSAFHFPNTAFTVELWAKRDALDGGSYYQYMASAAEGNGAGARNGWGIYVVPSVGGNNSHFEMYAIDGGESGSASKRASDGVWTQFVAVVDAQKKMTLYVDGVPGSLVAAVAMPETMADLVFATQNGTSRSFAGALDEVSIYGKALSQARIDAHRYAAGR